MNSVKVGNFHFGLGLIHLGYFSVADLDLIDLSIHIKVWSCDFSLYPLMFFQFVECFGRPSPNSGCRHLGVLLPDPGVLFKIISAGLRKDFAKIFVTFQNVVGWQGFYPVKIWSAKMRRHVRLHLLLSSPGGLPRQ
jgi:hypothetical protein